jgi:aquaporin Z
MKSYIAELIGTCLFTLVLILASGSGAWVVTIFAVFTLTMLSYTLGHVSGAHVNPAITLGAIVTARIKPLRGLYYIIAQLAGAALAILFSKWIGIQTIAAAHNPVSWRLFSAEFVGSMIFAFGVASVMFRRNEKGSAGFIVGLSLFGGIILSSLMLGNEATQGAVLNPAIAFGLNLISIEALLAPLLGAMLGMWIFVAVSEDARNVWKSFAGSFERKNAAAPAFAAAHGAVHAAPTPGHDHVHPVHNDDHHVIGHVHHDHSAHMPMPTSPATPASSAAEGSGAQSPNGNPQF